MFDSVKHAKLLLIGKNKCMECKYTKDIWLLADNNIRCTKTRNKVSMDYICLSWKKANDDKIREHWYYHKKYIEDRKFFEMMKKTQEMINKWKNQIS